jgi:hypothetical protein
VKGIQCGKVALARHAKDAIDAMDAQRIHKNFSAGAAVI